MRTHHTIFAIITLIISQSELNALTYVDAVANENTTDSNGVPLALGPDSLNSGDNLWSERSGSHAQHSFGGGTLEAFSSTAEAVPTLRFRIPDLPPNTSVGDLRIYMIGGAPPSGNWGGQYSFDNVTFTTFKQQDAGIQLVDASLGGVGANLAGAPSGNPRYYFTIASGATTDASGNLDIYFKPLATGDRLDLDGIAHDLIPSAVKKQLTNGSTTLTVNFTLHPIRESTYTVLTQGADGMFTPVTPDVPRTYIGTVVGRPGAIAAGYQKANGAFWSYIIFEDGSSWSSTGTAATASGGSTVPTVFPTTGVGAGGSGPVVRAAYLGVDSSYRHYLAAGSTVAGVVDIVEFSVMKTNLIFLRDVGILHRVGRIAIRTSAAKCPYEPSYDKVVLVNEARDQWAGPLSGPEDIVVAIKPKMEGAAFIGTVGTYSKCSICGSNTEGDFSGIWRHEAGHTWGSYHFEGGGKPEGQTIMSDNVLGRFSSSEAAKIISHRASKTGILENLGGYPFPLPPRVFGDRVTMTAGSIATTIDVLANDSDSNGEALSLFSMDGASSRRGLVVRSAGTGPSGRDQITYYAPPNYSSGFDYFNYRIQDSAGFQGIGKVSVNPTPLQPLPPLWVSGDIGGVGATGDSGELGGSYVIYGAGEDIWSTADEFHFVRQPTTGDCEIRARVVGQSDTNSWAKCGVMMRDGVSANAKHASMFVTPGNGFVFNYRPATGSASSSIYGPPLNAGSNNWVRITRIGDTFTGYSSEDGTTWIQVGSITIPSTETIQSGLAICSHNDALTGGAVVDNVSVSDGSDSIRLLDDTFEGASSTAANDVSDPLDAGWVAQGGATAIESDSTLGSGKALKLQPNDSFATIKGTFAGRGLRKTGDRLQATFLFRYLTTPSNNTAGFRFGLFNLAGAGYALQVGTGGSTSLALVSGTEGSGSGSYTTLNSGTTTSLNGTGMHQASISITKSDVGLDIRADVDGVEISASTVIPVSVDFDNILIRNGAISTAFRVDNARVDYDCSSPLKTVQQTYGSWAESNGLTSPLSGMREDFDRDGTINMMEYALGSNPNGSDGNKFLNMSRNAGKISLKYSRNPLALDMNIIPEYSADLSNWHTEGITIVPLGREGELDWFKAEIPMVDSLPGFLRLRFEIEQP